MSQSSEQWQHMSSESQPGEDLQSPGHAGICNTGRTYTDMCRDVPVLHDLPTLYLREGPSVCQ